MNPIEMEFLKKKIRNKTKNHKRRNNIIRSQTTQQDIPIKNEEKQLYWFEGIMRIKSVRLLFKSIET